MTLHISAVTHVAFEGVFFLGVKNSCVYRNKTCDCDFGIPITYYKGLQEYTKIQCSKKSDFFPSHFCQETYYGWHTDFIIATAAISSMWKVFWGKIKFIQSLNHQTGNDN